MKIVLKITFALIVFFLSTTNVFAQMPFTDINPSDPYYQAVWELFDARIISDDGTHLFRPNEPMNRDFFVSLATMIGCKECLTPTPTDLIKYQTSPFIDLPKTNEFYYCIAVAKDEEITHGYLPDHTGQAFCENGNAFSESPFCASNSITRIEAAAMLLRQAKLWDDTKNTGTFDKQETFSDVSDYWYGYAQKALQAGLLSKRADNSIGQNDKITRGEFAIMAARILEYTQCSFVKSDSTHASYIQISGSNGNPIKKTIFSEWDDFTLIPKTENGNWSYSWTAIDENGNTVTGNGSTFDGKTLPPWKWFIDVKISDPNSGKIISNPSTTITVLPKNFNPLDSDGDGVNDSDDKCPLTFGFQDNNWCPYNNENDDDDWDGIKNNDDKCPKKAGPASNNGCPFPTLAIGVNIFGTPDKTHIDNPINFNPIINNENQNSDFTYNWDFGDGNRNNTSGPKQHAYKQPGTYTVTLTVTDPKTGNSAQSSTIVRITNNRDTDGDGIMDSQDNCPLVRGSQPSGCPNINTPDYGCIIRGVYAGNIDCYNNFNIDTDGDGVIDSNDKCPAIPWPIANEWCPDNPNNDTDGDGVMDRDDRCPSIAWSAQNFGCPTRQSDTDGDGIIDDKDLCPQVRGPQEWNGCPYPALYGNISQNICLLNKLNNSGLITGSAQCNACPCINNISITSLIRECDILFPSILSPKKDTIYSRGNFYLVQ